MYPKCRQSGIAGLMVQEHFRYNTKRYGKCRPKTVGKGRTAIQRIVMPRLADNVLIDAHNCLGSPCLVGIELDRFNPPSEGDCHDGEFSRK